ncbi:uncharacterized protein LOC130290244 isoform X2 [Hyla sarda]|uniref:uncharacterized protein LOC130290244 isoform X2 n=1 Tax=Hyla sarda TaxID=327740 RepID=UPI0024C371E0|nr:uncharacterized protein LOC130290244 isoform X2 [Hyla sarda]
MTYKKTFMASIEVWAFILMIFSVAQTTHHVRVGTNTSICGFICEQPNGILLLQCRHKHSIFVAECINSTPEVKRKDSERLNLNLSSGCFLMTDVQKNDSCVYEIWFHDNKIHIKKSITIIILDAIQILNISSTFSHMGSDFSVHVQFSGAEATVSWEVDGIASPSRYELVDNNRTLIIRGAKDEDTKRKFVVRVKNPISEDVREYCLKTQETKCITEDKRSDQNARN